MQQPTENASGVSSAVSKSKSLVGPIVGGVVGGVMFLVIAIALIVFLIRREKRKVAPSAAYMRAHGGKLPTYRESMHGAVFPLGREKGIDMTENNSYTSDRPIRQESNSSEQSFDPYQDTRNASHLRSPSNGGRQSYTGVPQEPGTPHSYTEISVTNR
ncbi:hypothetical protein VNI00_003171 [Paramarasmius palmivorus]|uniref:Uncharacterized protein n=1 Tax=Paramarasmius palmivorus TaxID=297713 RepID=A0AAW0DS58_9AGAR